MSTDDILNERLLRQEDADKAAEAAEDKRRSEASLACGRCGAAGEFQYQWQLCEDCAAIVYYEDMDPMKAVRALLRSVGEDPEREGLRETPRRFVAMLRELSRQEPFSFTSFNAEGSDEMIVQSGITLQSLCEHHLAPFVGTAAVAYIPNGKIVGLSKLARAVRHCSRGLQNQERITRAVATMLQDQLQPQGVGVILQARHLCMELRGVREPNTWTTTSCMLGALREDAKARDEFLRLATVR